MNYSNFQLSILIFAISLSTTCSCEEVLFEDNFDNGLSTKWKISGKLDDDYRVRNGAVELRIQRNAKSTPVLRVELPFSTQDTVMASVNVKPIDDLKRGEQAGLCLLNHNEPEFSVWKTNIDGYQVFSPGEAEFIGKAGQEGDPSNYAVKYWPSRDSDGPLRILVRSHYAHFQVGPSLEGAYKTFFHSAIEESRRGMGFGIVAYGNNDKAESWVRFDNFRVVKP